MEKLSTLLIFFLFFFMNGQGQDTSAEISTKIYAIGPKSTYTGYTGTYTKLSDAISAISSAPINGNLIFEFQPDYIPSVETFPINLTSSIASNSAATITFRPAYRVNSVINFSSNGTVINNTGADYIIFDGRNGGTGDHKYFQFTSSSATAPVISLSGDALYNQILYSVLKGSNNTVTTGCILMINAPTTGNNFYTVDHCNFNASGSANNALYSSGIASNGTITNNNFFDFRNGAGINLANGSDNAVIDNNNFYQTAAYAGFTGTTSGILVAGGNNVRISNNNIGGSGPGLTGTWTVSSTIPATYNFTGINATSLATTSIIYNNRIQSFDWKSNVSTWTGINVSGSVNVGSNGANYVGNDTVNNIKITYYLAGKAKVAGIIASGAAIIENNNIGSITTILNGVTETGSSFTGINSSGTGRINHNTIGSSTVPNSINTAFQSSSNNLQNVYGIYSSGSTAFITNNTIANITNNSSVATGHTRGILVSNSATSININSNDIHSISTSQPVISKADTASLDGINIQLASLANVIIAGNTIYDLVNTTNAAISINGILYNSSSVKSNRIEKNYIHSFKTFSNTATQNGINIILGAANIQNNVVRLGIDKEGSSITSTAQINGILKAGTYATNFYFNTVYIGGENVTAGSIKTCALNLYAKSGSVEESYNNLFINMRTHAVANKLNYAVIWPSIAAMAWASDYNIYNVSRTDGILGNVNNLDVSSLKTLQESFTGADLHSGFGDPLLVNPTGALTTLDLHPATATEAESTGILIKDITDDITGTIRSTSTPTDIGAYSGNFTQVAPSLDIFSPGISYNNLGNGSTTDYRLTYNFASITDIISGINVSPGTKPRLYYKSSSNANTFVGNTSADNGWKWVEALGSTSPFDFKIDYSLLYGPISKGSTIQYFVVAQNQAATPAVSFSPSAGASGTSVAPTEMKAPSTPNSFTIVSLIPASINVGTGQPYTTLTGQNGVFAALNAGVINSNTVVTITSDISEPGTNSLNQVNEEGP
ncbi:MAG: hypothetical protein Q8904_15205, partial [Bacteroidota bacterium]|nr:hypothetical protein [Bacteroidota bacterium]